MKALRIEIKGRVQGVNFRYICREFCLQEKINGFVRNAENGDAEIIAQGDEGKLNKLLNWLKKSPGFSKIEEIEVFEIKMKKKFDSFEIVRNGSYIIDKIEGVKNLGRRVFR